MESEQDQAITAVKPRNRFDRSELAGAFGDLGTLIPFVVAYISVLKLDAFGVLLPFGLAMIVCGFVYRTPFPVQPMKAAGAIATTQAAQTLVITPAAVYAATLTTGILWLLLGLTGTARYVAKLVQRPVVLGIILGLGIGFMIEGGQNDVAELVDRWRSIAWYFVAAHQSDNTRDVSFASIWSRLWRLQRPDTH